jgi:hypothetical protein
VTVKDLKSIEIIIFKMESIKSENFATATATLLEVDAVSPEDPNNLNDDAVFKVPLGLKRRDKEAEK